MQQQCGMAVVAVLPLHPSFTTPSMSKQIEVSLIPAPGAKAEFLATVEALEDVSEWSKLPSKVVLEGYTRDPWAWKPHPNAWTQLVVVSVDGRNKLQGFMKYLKDRQKCAYGRFSPIAVWVVSYIQKGASGDNEMSIRLCFDISLLDKCPLYKGPPSVAKKEQKISKRPVVTRPQAATTAAASVTTTTTKKKSGLLGSLLGAQQRTNQHLARAAPTKKATAAAAADEAEATRTAQQVLAEHREKMEQEMLDFDSCGEVVLKCEIKLSDMQKGLSESDKGKITMDVLKYIVFEAAEECNEEWIAYKEPSEFMDECKISIYKEGHAPDDVLEEVNRVEMTEEMRGEQRAISEANKRKQASEDAKLDQVRFQQAVREQQEAEEFAALNTNKRDRRTIEEIQLGLEPEKKVKI